MYSMLCGYLKEIVRLLEDIKRELQSIKWY